MIINLQNIKIYYINSNNELGYKKREHIERILRSKNLNFERINNPEQSLLSGPIGHSLALLRGLNKENFEPFLVLEDNIEFYKNLEHNDFNLSIPYNTDALFLGLSTSGINNSNDTNNIYLKNIENYPNIIRIFNMLSMHAILYVNPKFVSMQLISIFEAIYTLIKNNNIIWNTICCHHYHQFNIYALKEPYFYQLNELNGSEAETKVDFLNKSDNIRSDEKYSDISTITENINKYILNK